MARGGAGGWGRKSKNPLLRRTTRKLGLTQAGERCLAEVLGPMERVAEASSQNAFCTGVQTRSPRP
jgi:DNA-binding transcriptional LysR family regulator